MRSRLVSAVLATALMVDAVPISSQERVDVRFEPGVTGTTLNGSIQGSEYIDYVLNARAGQLMTVVLDVTDTNGYGSAFFNILPAGQDYGGPYIGSTDEDRRAEVTVPSDGDWAIRVYLMRNDRDTGTTVGFSLQIEIEALPAEGPSAQTRVPERSSRSLRSASRDSSTASSVSARSLASSPIR